MIPTRDGLRRTTLYTFLILLVVVGAPVFVLVRPYALTLLMAAILAVICGPPYQRLRVRGWRRHWAAGITTLGLVLLVLAPISLFTWAALQQAVALAGTVSQAEVLDIHGHIERIREWGPMRRLPMDPSELEEQLRAGVARLGAWATTFVLSGIAQVPSILLHGALAVLACFFFLSDGRRLVNWLAGKLPLPPQIVDVLRSSFRRSAAAVVLASMAAAGAQATVTLLSFGILGVPAAFVAAGVAFVFAWVPLLGVGPVYLLGILALIAQGHPVRALILLLFGCLAGVIDNIVRPAVLGGQEQLHPMTSLVAIFGGIATFGIFGAFIGPVLVAVLIALLETWPAVARYCGVEVADTGSPPEIDLEEPRPEAPTPSEHRATDARPPDTRPPS